jgi:hypothetical protein
VVQKLYDRVQEKALKGGWSENQKRKKMETYYDRFMKTYIEGDKEKEAILNALFPRTHVFLLMNHK